MQNRYAGDVGDFGKLGLLRAIEKHGLKVGINWYLVDNESHNADGKHTGYLNSNKFDFCDDELREKLRKIIDSNIRSVKQLEDSTLLQDAIYYHETIQTPKAAGKTFRQNWHLSAFNVLSPCDIIFLDPDNGLLPKSKSKARKDSIKYVFENEILDYYKSGHSVVFYNHRTREQVDAYLKRFDKLFHEEDLKDAHFKGLTFSRGTTRDYLFIVQPKHQKIVDECIKNFLSSSWNKHFKKLL